MAGKNIFNLDGSYVDNAGRDFEKEVERLLTPVVDKLFKDGYNLWQVDLLLKNSISSLAFYVDLDNRPPSPYYTPREGLTIIHDEGPEPDFELIDGPEPDSGALNGWYGKASN